MPISRSKRRIKIVVGFLFIVLYFVNSNIRLVNLVYQVSQVDDLSETHPFILSIVIEGVAC